VGCSLAVSGNASLNAGLTELDLLQEPGCALTSVSLQLRHGQRGARELTRCPSPPSYRHHNITSSLALLSLPSIHISSVHTASVSFPASFQTLLSSPVATMITTHLSRSLWTLLLSFCLCLCSWYMLQ
jgi:hypothetical protein